MIMKNFSRGFTLIELLVVMAVIGILSSIVLTSLNSAREKAKITVAKQQLRQVISGVALLEDDVGKTLNGCPIGVIANHERSLNDANIGLYVAPSVMSLDDGCEWTAADIAKWKGPYIKAPIDSWGNAYFFDPDYEPFGIGGCTLPAQPVIAAIISYGPDGIGPNVYNCDDIYIKLP